jgi:hypothetical protein
MQKYVPGLTRVLHTHYEKKNNKHVFRSLLMHSDFIDCLGSLAMFYNAIVNIIVKA